VLTAVPRFDNVTDFLNYIILGNKVVGILVHSSGNECGSNS